MVEAQEQPPRGQRSADTTPEIEAMQLERIRAMSPQERVLLVDQLSQDVVEVARAGILATGRFTTDRQIQRELCRRLHGEELAAEVFGPAEV